jgi:hypothetical protein
MGGVAGLAPVNHLDAEGNSICLPWPRVILRLALALPLPR